MGFARWTRPDSYRCGGIKSEVWSDSVYSVSSVTGRSESRSRPTKLMDLRSGVIVRVTRPWWWQL